MSGAAQVDPVAVDEAARALVRYGNAEEAVIAQVDSAIQQASAQAQAEQGRRRTELGAAEAALRACQTKERADCSKQAEAVRKARARLDAANQAARHITAAAGRYQAVRARHKATVQALVRDGRTHINRKSQQINTYMSSSGGAGGTGGGLGQNRSDARLITLGMILKAMGTEGAKVAAIPLALEGFGLLAHTDALNGSDSLFDDAILSVRDSRLGVRFEQIGDAMSQIRSQLSG